MAVDSQGEPALRRYADPVADAFPVLVDADNRLGELFGFKAIPNGIFVGSSGRIDSIIAGRFDLRRREIRDLVEGWVERGETPFSRRPDGSAPSPEARDLFLQATGALRRGDRREAIRLLELAVQLEPDNLIIRKQLWAIEHPDRFYSGDIDHEWQKRQLEQGR